jgi:zinc transporter
MVDIPAVAEDRRTMDTLPVSMPGFVWGYRFPPDGGKPTRLTNSAVAADLTVDGGFYWLHLNLADARVPALLDTLAGLNDDAKIGADHP